MTTFIQAAFAAVLAAQSAPTAQVAVPFGVGESFEYGGSYHLAPLINPGASKAATLSVVAIDTVDGVPYWKFSFVTNFSAPFYHQHSELYSWTSVDHFVSRHFIHRIDETGYSLHDDIHIYPDSAFYRNVGDLVPRATPPEPLDDVAFFYFIRLPTTPLEINHVYPYNRYFRGNRNPVVITVLGREPCALPDGTKPQCLVLNPVVEDPPHGMLMKDKNARVWITDDARRIPVEIKAGPMTLTLKKFVMAPSTH